MPRLLISHFLCLRVVQVFVCVLVYSEKRGLFADVGARVSNPATLLVPRRRMCVSLD